MNQRKIHLCTVFTNHFFLLKWIHCYRNHWQTYLILRIDLVNRPKINQHASMPAARSSTYRQMDLTQRNMNAHIRSRDDKFLITQSARNHQCYQERYIARTSVIIIRMITNEMRDTESDPAASGRPAVGSGVDACRRRSRRVVKAFGDKLGELLHPHGYRSNSRARRRASAPTALAAVVAGEPPPGTRRRRRRDATHRPGPPFGRRPIRRRLGVTETPRIISRWSLPCRALDPFREAGVLALSPSTSPKTDAH